MKKLLVISNSDPSKLCEEVNRLSNQSTPEDHYEIMGVTSGSVHTMAGIQLVHFAWMMRS